MAYTDSPRGKAAGFTGLLLSGLPLTSKGSNSPMQTMQGIGAPMPSSPHGANKRSPYLMRTPAAAAAATTAAQQQPLSPSQHKPMSPLPSQSNMPRVQSAHAAVMHDGTLHKSRPGTAAITTSGSTAAAAIPTTSPATPMFNAKVPSSQALPQLLRSSSMPPSPALIPLAVPVQSAQAETQTAAGAVSAGPATTGKASWPVGGSVQSGLPSSLSTLQKEVVTVLSAIQRVAGSSGDMPAAACADRGAAIGVAGTVPSVTAHSVPALPVTQRSGSAAAMPFAPSSSTQTPGARLSAWGADVGDGDGARADAAVSAALAAAGADPDAAARAALLELLTVNAATLCSVLCAAFGVPLAGGPVSAPGPQQAAATATSGMKARGPGASVGRPPTTPATDGGSAATGAPVLGRTSSFGALNVQAQSKPGSRRGSETGEASAPATCSDACQVLVRAAGAITVARAQVAMVQAADADRKELKAKLEHAQQDITLLRNALAEATGAAGRPQSRSALRAESQPITLPAEVNALRAQLDAARASLANRSSELVEASTKIAAAAAERDTAARERLRLESELAAACKARDSAAAMSDMLRSELSTCQGQLRDRASELAALKAQLAGQAGSAEHEISALRRQLASQQAAARASEGSLEGRVAAMSAELASLQALRPHLAQADQERSALAARVSALGNERGTLQDQLADAQMRASQLSDQLQQAHADHAHADALQSQLDAARAACTKWEAQAATLQKQLDEARARASSAEGQVQVLQGRFRDAAARASTSESRASELEALNRSLQHELLDLRTALAAAEGRASDLDGRMFSAIASRDGAEGRVRAAERTVAQAADAQARAEAAAADLAARCARLESELAQARDVQRDLDAERAALAEEMRRVAALQAQLASEAASVKAMGTLVQAKTLRFDLNTSGMMPPLHPGSPGSAAPGAVAPSALRPASGVPGMPESGGRPGSAHDQAANVRLGNMVRELQGQLAAANARAAERDTAAIAARMEMEAQAARVNDAEGRAAAAEARAEAAEARAKDVTAARAAAAQPMTDSQALRQVGTAHAEAAAARHAADEKTKLASALGDQVTRLKRREAELERELAEARAALPSWHKPRDSHNRPPSPSIPTTAATATALQPPLAPPPAAGCGPAEVHSMVAVIHDGPSSEGYEALLAELARVKAHLALMASKLEGAEETIHAQDALLAQSQARLHALEGQVNSTSGAAAGRAHAAGEVGMVEGMHGDGARSPELQQHAAGGSGLGPIPEEARPFSSSTASNATGLSGSMGGSSVSQMSSSLRARPWSAAILSRGGPVQQQSPTQSQGTGAWARPTSAVAQHAHAASDHAVYGMLPVSPQRPAAPHRAMVQMRDSWAEAQAHVEVVQHQAAASQAVGSPSQQQTYNSLTAQHSNSPAQYSRAGQVMYSRPVSAAAAAAAAAGPRVQSGGIATSLAYARPSSAAVTTRKTMVLLSPSQAPAEAGLRPLGAMVADMVARQGL